MVGLCFLCVLPRVGSERGKIGMAEYIEVSKILEYLDVMIDALSFPLSESGEEVKAYVEGFKEARSVV